MTEGHSIPSWFIPDEKKVLANDAEKEQIAKYGEVVEPLCPYCQNTYINKSGDTYTHRLVEVEPDFAFDESTYKPGLVCVNGERRYLNGYSPLDDSDEWLDFP